MRVQLIDATDGAADRPGSSSQPLTLWQSPRVSPVAGRGVCVSENRVARLTRDHGIRARVATLRYTVPNMKRFFGSLPNRQHEHPASEPNQVWVGDITYLKVGTIYHYLAEVMDRCSRRIVGWAFGRQKNVVLTLRALNHAWAVVAHRPD